MFRLVAILSPQPSGDWDYRCELPYLAGSLAVLAVLEVSGVVSETIWGRILSSWSLRVFGPSSDLMRQPPPHVKGHVL